MLNINGKNLCESCFAELGDYSGVCPFCGGNRSETEFVTALKNGVVLAGRYVVGKVLGKGGFGVTYLCYDTKSSKRVAIKEYFPDAVAHRNSGETLVSTQLGSGDDSFKMGAQKFYDEAKLVSRFNGNPNIISVHEFFFENNTAYFVMEYLDGIDLKHYMGSKGGKLPESEALYVLDKISEALVIVHSMGVLHRDISPDNIFLTNDGNIKLIDFGAARQVMGEASKNLSVILKQGFAPLEQYQKKGKQGPWTDIYALGATIYYSVTGRVIDDAMSRLDNDELDGSGISPALFAVLKKMLSVRVETRYQSIVELKRDLVSLVAGAVPPQLEKSQKTRFCPKCGKEVHGNQVLCNECSGTSTNTASYGTSANPVNYGTSVHTVEQYTAPKVTENKKSKIKIPYIIAACVSAVAIIAGTVVGIVLSSKSKSEVIEIKKKDTGGSKEAGVEIVKEDKPTITAKDLKNIEVVEEYETAITSFMEAYKNCDGEKTFRAILPYEYIKTLASNNGVSESDMFDGMQKSLNETKEEIEGKGFNWSEMRYEIGSCVDSDVESIENLSEFLGEEVGRNVEAVKMVSVNLIYPAYAEDLEDFQETPELCVYKFDGMWYVDVWDS